MSGLNNSVTLNVPFPGAVTALPYYVYGNFAGAISVTNNGAAAVYVLLGTTALLPTALSQNPGATLIYAGATVGFQLPTWDPGNPACISIQPLNGRASVTVQAGTAAAA
jgi:hypothetical protein